MKARPGAKDQTIDLIPGATPEEAPRETLRPGGVASEVRSATSESGGRETLRELKRANRELVVRVRELELELAGRSQRGPDAADAPASGTEDSTGIIALINDLHEEIDRSHELKDALETDLAAVRDEAARERAARTELEARVYVLEAKEALVDQLREEVSFVEEQRGEATRRLEEITAQLRQTTDEYDALVEQRRHDEATLQELHARKVDLEAKIIRLEKAVSEMEGLRRELVEAGENTRRLEEQVRNTEAKLEASEMSKRAIELDLSTTREVVRNQHEQIDRLTESLGTAQSELSALRGKLERQDAENARLHDSNRSAERELRSLKNENESLKRELDSCKKALGEIRSVTQRTAEHVRERYAKK